jgi:hypothetical protein
MEHDTYTPRSNLAGVLFIVGLGLGLGAIYTYKSHNVWVPFACLFVFCMFGTWWANRSARS